MVELIATFSLIISTLSKSGVDQFSIAVVEYFIRYCMKEESSLNMLREWFAIPTNSGILALVPIGCQAFIPTATASAPDLYCICKSVPYGVDPSSVIHKGVAVPCEEYLRSTGREVIHPSCSAGLSKYSVSAR